MWKEGFFVKCNFIIGFYQDTIPKFFPDSPPAVPWEKNGKFLSPFPDAREEVFWTSDEP